MKTKNNDNISIVLRQNIYSKMQMRNLNSWDASAANKILYIALASVVYNFFRQCMPLKATPAFCVAQKATKTCCCYDDDDSLWLQNLFWIKYLLPSMLLFWSSLFKFYSHVILPINCFLTIASFFTFSIICKDKIIVLSYIKYTNTII